MVSFAEKILRMPASRELFAGTVVFLACYVFACVSGVAGDPKDGIMATFQSRAAIGACIILMVHSLCRLFLLVRAGLTSKDANVIAAVFQVGILLLSTGAVASGLTRFEARVLVSESQHFGRGGVEYHESPAVSARWAVPPQAACFLERVEPNFWGNGSRVWDITARLECDGSQQGVTRAVKVRKHFPSFVDGTLLTVTDFGYTPFFRLSSSGTILDEGNVLLRLFPPGSEDFFQASVFPYTFFVRYYPGSSETEKPHYSLRIARNIDLLLPTRTVAPEEVVAVDPWTQIMFADAQKWAEIRIVRDFGLFLIMPGFAVACAGVLLGARRKITAAEMIEGSKTSGPESVQEEFHDV